MLSTMARQLIEAIRNGDQLQARNILRSERYGCIDCQTAKRDGTALFWACAKGFLELVQLLIAKGANVNARTNYTSTPLIAAADNNRHHVVRLLIQHGADLNAQTSNGDTACHQAAYRGHVEAVKLLVAAGADVDVTNAKFRTPFDEATRQGHIDLLPLLDGSVVEKLRGRTRGGVRLDQHSLHPHTPDTHPHRDTYRAPPAPLHTATVPPPALRRHSCDCPSHDGLSRESSYEDCGQAAVVVPLTAYDFTQCLQDPDPFFYPSSASSTAATFASSSYPASRDEVTFSVVREDLPRTGPSAAASSLPYSSYSEAQGINDLSLPSVRSSSKSSWISPLNIPA